MGFYTGHLILSMYMLQFGIVYSGPMRNYTNGYHPAGGADPRYLDYGAGVVVPNLVNPRRPGPGVSLTPRHHLERYIGVRPGLPDDDYSSDYNGDYYDDGENSQNDSIFSDEKSDLVLPDLINVDQYELTHTDSEYNWLQTSGISQGHSSDEGLIVSSNNENNEFHYEEQVALNVNSTMHGGKIHCRDGGRGYRSGEVFKFSSDPCIKCTCSRFGPQCNRIQCEQLPLRCLELLKRPDECCPLCLKEGCSIGNVTLSAGERFELNACETCHCEEDGILQCSVADCTPPPCVDSIIQDGQCCPVCPNGPNCHTSNQTIIPAKNEWVKIRGQNCTICRCWHKPGSEQLWMGNRKAECKPDPTCNV